MMLSSGKRGWQDYVGAAGSLGYDSDFLVKSRLGLPLLATRALLVYPPARGEQGDGPMDNEGFYVDNEGNMVQVLRKQKSAGIPPADFFTKIINSFEKMFDFFCSMW